MFHIYRVTYSLLLCQTMPINELKMKKNIQFLGFILSCLLHLTQFLSVQSDSPYLPLRYHLNWWGERRQPQYFGRSMGWSGNFYSNSIQTVQDWERCKGFSEEESEGVECFLTLGGKVSCTSWVEVNKELRFRCSSGFIAKNSRDQDGNSWHCSICLGNGQWSNNEINIFSCEINYGYFEALKRFSPLIFNGSVTDSKSAPWNAAIFIGRNFYCGATLISPSFILTASHCLFSPDEPPTLFALSHFRIVFATTSGDYEEAVQQENVQLHDVVEMYVHPEYTDYPKYLNDIAILKLKKKVKISKHVLPVLLPSEIQAREIESRSWMMRVNGLGISSKDSDQPTRKLYGVEVTTKSSNCRTFESFEDKQICLSPIDTASGICHGDSGGGAFIEYPPNSRRFYIQGLVSTGNENTKRLSDHCFTTVIFTKVYSYMFWIQSIILPQRFITTTTTKTTTTTTAAPVSTTQSTTTPATSTSTTTRKPTTRRRKIVQTTTRQPSTTTTTSLPPPRSFSASPPPQYSSEWCTNTWRTLGVEIHNELRRRHGITPLRLDCKLSQEAQEYANFAVNFIAQPKYGITWGQNIYSSKGSALNPDDAIRRAIERWYTGLYEYNWQFPLSSPGYGHSFSQVLWKNSERVGFGVGTTIDHTLVVAFYSPAGNDPTSNQRYKENVYPLLQRANY